jgi:CRISPR-associated endoribonuclease Cas6
MLYSVELRLEALQVATLSTPNGYHANALLLALLRSVNPGLASRLHSADGPRPYTTSFLPFRKPGRASERQASSQARVSLRLTFLEDAPFTSLADSVLKLDQHHVLQLGEGGYRCLSLATTPVQSPWARTNSFEALLEGAPDDVTVSLRFLSLTTFRSGGRRSVLFPEPSLVFGSLLAKWNAFSPIPLDAITHRDVFSRMQVVYYRLHTGAASFGTYEELGFLGTCTYAIAGAESVEVRRNIHALATFSFYGGAGAKTTMGMGQCRRMSHARAVSRGTGSDAAQGR